MAQSLSPYNGQQGPTDPAPSPLPSPLTHLLTPLPSCSPACCPSGLLHLGSSPWLFPLSRPPYSLFPHFLQGSAQMSPSHRGPPIAPPLAHHLPLYLTPDVRQYHIFPCLAVYCLSLSLSPLSVLLGLVS